MYLVGVGHGLGEIAFVAGLLGGALFLLLGSSRSGGILVSTARVRVDPAVVYRTNHVLALETKETPEKNSTCANIRIPIGKSLEKIKNRKTFWEKRTYSVFRGWWHRWFGLVAACPIAVTLAVRRKKNNECEQVRNEFISCGKQPMKNLQHKKGK